jgi:hypothetical protein
MRCPAAAAAGQARRFPEGSDVKLFYEVGLQYFLICVVIVVLISGGW